MSDLRDELERAAGEPAPLDLDAILTRTRQIRGRRLAAFTIMMSLCMLLTVAALDRYASENDNRVLVAGPSTGASAVPPMTAAPLEQTEQLCDPPTITTPSGNTEWHSLGQQALAIALEEAPENFAGIVLDNSDRKVVVFLTPGAEPTANRIANALGDYARITWVERSYDELLALRDRLTRERDWFSGIGLSVLRWGPDAARNVVEVGVRDGFTARQAALVEERYGDAVRLCGPEGPYDAVAGLAGK